MNKRRDLQLTERFENTRDKTENICTIDFRLDEIYMHFRSNMHFIHSQFDIAVELSNVKKAEEACYIWRSQIVFAVSALDFFMHEITKYGMNKMFCGYWTKSTEYNKTRVLLSDVENGLKSPESHWFVECINHVNAAAVFASYEKISQQLRLLGINKSTIDCAAYPKPEEPGSVYDSAEVRINRIWKRRNQIAHQSDRCHENAIVSDINEETVKTYIADIESYVNAIYQAVAKKDSD